MLGGGTVSYRVDATVLVPLVFTAVPIAHRTDVGVAAFSIYDCAEASHERLRAFEFFAGSFPDRARGLNRLGLLREAVRLQSTGPAGTAHFGVISANREKSVEEAEQAIDGATLDGQPYAFISGIIGPTEASNAVMRTTLPGRWTNAHDLYRDVRPVWASGPLAYMRTVPNAEHQAYQSPVGFLGSLQISLRSVAVAATRGDIRGRPSVAYVHNGHVYQLVVSNFRVDDKEGRDCMAQGLVSPSSNVWRIEYRILDERREQVGAFRIWAELPGAPVNDPFAAPIVPLAFEFRPRSFLELRAVRTAP